MSHAEVSLLMLDEAAANGAEFEWVGDNDTAPDVEALRTRAFDFSWQ